MNPLRELLNYGQSPWYDNIQRRLLQDGTIQRMIDEDGLRGITSNPTIFDKAISGSRDYDEAFRRLVAAGATTDKVFDALTVEDIQQAADLLRPVYDETDGADGFVSIEVSPLLANDTETTIAEAKRLWQLVNRLNIFVKIPGTAEGVPAIEAAISEGINVNVTLLFSLLSYEQIAEAYIRGLETLAQTQPASLKRVASVASFFVSRVDTAVDKAIAKKLAELGESGGGDGKDQALLRNLLGKVGIANSKLAYQKYKEIFGGQRFQTLEMKGACRQRVLWASTGTKNPEYGDVLYIESLIGPNTVNTMPQATWDAFRDHGRVRATLEEDASVASTTVQALGRFDISLDQITHQLQVDGVRLFSESYEALLRTIEKKREELLHKP